MAVRKYRPRANVVDAEQFDGSQEAAERIEKWTKKKAEARPGDFGWSLLLHTTNGLVPAHVGDWILKDANGDVLALSADRFTVAYEQMRD